MSKEPDDQTLRQEYALSQAMHNYYGRITWEIGTIFLGGGLAAIGFALQARLQPMALILFAIAPSALFVAFLLLVRRYRVIAEIHLARCREIESSLGMWQHRYARQGNNPEGVLIRQELQSGLFEQSLRVPLPSGWRIVQYLILVILVGVWIAVLWIALAGPPLT